MRPVKKKLIIIVLAGLFLPALLLAQQPKGKPVLTASASKKEVAAGAPIEITFQLSGSAGGQLRPPAFGAFRQSGGTQEMSGMQFSGGEMRAHHTWVFSLTAPGPGEYTIPEAMVILNGVAIKSQPLTIRVVEPGKAIQGGGIKSVPEGSDPNLFITTEFNRKSAYVGQQVICTVNVYTRQNVAGVDMVSLPKAGTNRMKDLERYDMPVVEETVGGVKYTKRAIYAGAFFPEKEGKITVPPVQVNISLEPTNIFMPTRPQRLSTEAVYIDVKPLPSPAPAGFTGVVGEYHVEAKTDHDTAALGEAFLCEISIRGNGNGRYFSPPKLVFPEGLEGFDPVVKEDESFENGQELIHRQVLEYAISAKQTGDYNWEPTIVWFDPDSSKYISFSPKLTLKVLDQNPNGTEKVNAPPQRIASENTFWTSPKFIGIASLGVAGILLLLYFLLFQKRGEPAPQPVVSKPAIPEFQAAPAPQPTPVFEQKIMVQEPEIIKPTPVPQARSLAQMQALMESGDHRSFYQALQNAVLNNFSAQIGRPANTLSAEQIAVWMNANGYQQQSIGELQLLLQWCEENQYAGQTHIAEMPLAMEKAKQFIRV